VHADEASARVDIQSPQAQEWLKEHVGHVVSDAEVAGVKGYFDEWAGFVDGRLVDVAAGYEFSDPMVGVIFISDLASSQGRRFQTPVHAGPVTIDSEQDGILVLKTIPGRYEKTGDEFGNGHDLVTISDQRKFRFDLRANRFIGP
jgi:hypothetical protein